MTILEKEVLDCLKNNLTISEIKNKLNINNTSLLKVLHSLENKGYSSIKEYYASGKVKLKLAKAENKNKFEIKDIPNNFKLGVFSDSHYGSNFEREDYIDKAMDYFDKINISYVIHGGDFVEGITNNSSFKNIDNEVKYALKRYPKKENMTTFLTLGDHDYLPFQKDGYNIENIIESKRLDITPIGVKKGKINLGNDSIGVIHKSVKKNKSIFEDKITLIGHGHRSGCEKLGNHLNIYIPPISDIIIGSFAPGFIVLFLDFNNNKKIQTVCVRRMVIENQPLIATEDTYQFVKK